MNKTIITTVLVFALALLVEAGAASAFSGYPYLGPQSPVVDGTVRNGGTFYGSSPYFVNLRGGIVTHPRQDFALRTDIASRFYPRQPSYWLGANRNPYDNPYSTRARVGGYYGSRYGSFRGLTKGDFTFNGHYGSRLGGGTITGFY